MSATEILTIGLLFLVILVVAAAATALVIGVENLATRAAARTRLACHLDVQRLQAANALALDDIRRQRARLVALDASAATVEPEPSPVGRPQGAAPAAIDSGHAIDPGHTIDSAHPLALDSSGGEDR